MKTSNKLLLGLFVLILVVITIGFVILKVEFTKLNLSFKRVDGAKTEKYIYLTKLDNERTNYLNYI